MRSTNRLTQYSLIRFYFGEQFIQPRVTDEDLAFLLAEIARLGADL
jgi:hypothetical protein